MCIRDRGNVCHGALAHPAQGDFEQLVAARFGVQAGKQKVFRKRLFPAALQYRHQLWMHLQQIAQVAAVVESGLPAGVECGVHAVSYTHLDVYKRQEFVVGVELAEPETGESMLALFRVGKNLFELLADALAVPIQFSSEAGPVGKVH